MKLETLQTYGCLSGYLKGMSFLVFTSSYSSSYSSLLFVLLFLLILPRPHLLPLPLLCLFPPLNCLLPFFLLFLLFLVFYLFSSSSFSSSSSSSDLLISCFLFS